MFVADFDGDLVNLFDKSIEIWSTDLNGDYGAYDYMVIAISSVEFVNEKIGHVLHAGTSVECEQFRDKLRNSLQVFQVKGVTSTKRIDYH